MSGNGAIQTIQKRRMDYQARLESGELSRPTAATAEIPSYSSQSYNPAVLAPERPIQSDSVDYDRPIAGSRYQPAYKVGFWSAIPEWTDYLLEAIMSAFRNFFYGSSGANSDVTARSLAVKASRKNKSKRPLSITSKKIRTY